VSSGLTTITRFTCGSRIRAISQAPPLTSSATRSSALRLRANSSSRSGVVSTRPAERTAPSSAIATSQKSRCTSTPIDLPTALTSSSSRRWTGEQAGERQRPIRARGTTRASRRGGQRRQARARSASSKTACPAAFSQKAPVPDHPNVGSEPDSNLPRMIFMPRPAAATRWRPRTCASPSGSRRELAVRRYARGSSKAAVWSVRAESCLSTFPALARVPVFQARRLTRLV
jgi:hypothetical protein